MTSLRQQLQEIQKKLAKIELYTRICENLKKEKEDLPEFPGLMAEVAREVIDFCNRQIRSIEGVELSKEQDIPKIDSIPVIKNSSPQEDDLVFQDPLKFIVAYKSWINKKVIVKNGENPNVEGKVLGAAFPNLKVIVNDTVIIVNPKDLKLKE